MSVVVYSAGLVMASVCAPSGMPQAEVEAAANLESPTGISSRWSVADEPWKGTDTVGPVPCDQDPTRTHWLMSC